MAHTSCAPDRYVSSDGEDSRPTVRPRPPLRLSRIPSPHANIAALLPFVEDTFRRLGTSATAPADNDQELTEEEIFAVWVARLL